jgi:chromate transporter
VQHPGAPLRIAVAGLLLWLLPLVAVALALGPQSLWSRVYLFFSQAALVTFGGAYAVLGYVTQHLVQDLGWLTAGQSVAGLALAETTPGPLVIVLQFMGFMAGWNQPGVLDQAASAVLAALLASWATFLPSFVFIFLGAPYVERVTRAPRLSAALAAITAAVVGIIATLALLLARVVLLPEGWSGGVGWAALAIAATVWWTLERTKVELHWMLLAAALAGLAAQALGGA